MKKSEETNDSSPIVAPLPSIQNDGYRFRLFRSIDAPGIFVLFGLLSFGVILQVRREMHDPGLNHHLQESIRQGTLEKDAWLMGLVMAFQFIPFTLLLSLGIYLLGRSLVLWFQARAMVSS